MRSCRFLVLGFLAVAACGSSTPEPAPAPAPSKTEAANADPKVMCVTVLQRMRTCSELFIPALVDLRVRYDRPPGIAAADKEKGRDAMVAQASEAWKVDSTDAHIATLCADIDSKLTPELQELVNAGRECLAQEACSDSVGCVIPLIEAPWKTK